MSASRRKKKKAFRFTAPAVFALVAVFVVSVGIGTVGVSTASRMSQLAVAKEADAKCLASWDYSTPCKQKSKSGKTGGKDCPCPDFTNGHETPGKCQAANVCKGEPPKGDGKPPEMKPPEPPKDDKPPEQKPDPCSSQGSLSGQNSSGLDANGQPCPSSSSALSNELLGSLGTDLGLTATENADDTSNKTFSWSTVGRVLQDVTEAVGNVFSNSNAAVKPSETERATLYPDAQTVALQAQSARNEPDVTGANQASHYTSPNLNTFGQPAQGSDNAQNTGGGFWDTVVQTIKDFFHI